MRLLRQKSREYKGKHYFKSWIVVPNTLLQKLGWNEGQDLEAEVKNDKLIITRNNKVRVDLVTIKEKH